MNPLVQLGEFGQSPWYDYIRRGLLTSGELKALIDKDGLMGVTSNPSIFEKAIGGSTERGTQSFDVALYALYKSGKVMLEEALSNADSRANLEAKINFG